MELVAVHSSNSSEERETQPANWRSTPLDVGQKETLLVVHVVSPREVYLVKKIDDFYNFVLEVNKRAERLKYEALFRPSVGSLVFVQGSDDIWYRAEVLSLDGETFEFFGVDFGFTETARLTRARDIPQDYIKEAKYFGKKYLIFHSAVDAQYLAVKCSLSEDQADDQPDLETNVIVKAKVLEQRHGCYILHLNHKSSNISHSARNINLLSSESSEVRTENYTRKKLDLVEEALREKTAEASSLQQRLEVAETRCESLQSLVSVLREERDKLKGEQSLRDDEGDTSEVIIEKLESERKQLTGQMKIWGSAYQNISNQYFHVHHQRAKMKQKNKEISDLEQKARIQLELQEKELNEKNEEIKVLKELSWLSENQEGSPLLSQQNQDLIRRNEELQRSMDKMEKETQTLEENYMNLIRENVELGRKLRETAEQVHQEEDQKPKPSTRPGASSTTCNPEAFHCCVCHRDFLTEKLLQVHLNNHFQEDKAFCWCPLCHQKFGQTVSWAQLMDHMQEHEDQIRKIQEFINLEFINLANL